MTPLRRMLPDEIGGVKLDSFEGRRVYGWLPNVPGGGGGGICPAAEGGGVNWSDRFNSANGSSGAGKTPSPNDYCAGSRHEPEAA